MARINKNSRRQRLIGLNIGAYAIFPKSIRGALGSQISEVQASTGQRYSMESSDKLVKVVRIS